jgi:hypothetical protein
MHRRRATRSLRSGARQGLGGQDKDAVKRRLGPGKQINLNCKSPAICRAFRSALGRTRTCGLLIRSLNW